MVGSTATMVRLEPVIGAVTAALLPLAAPGGVRHARPSEHVAEWSACRAGARVRLRHPRRAASHRAPRPRRAAGTAVGHGRRRLGGPRRRRDPRHAVPGPVGSGRHHRGPRPPADEPGPRPHLPAPRHAHPSAACASSAGASAPAWAARRRLVPPLVRLRGPPRRPISPRPCRPIPMLVARRLARRGSPSAQALLAAVMGPSPRGHGAPRGRPLSRAPAARHDPPRRGAARPRPAPATAAPPGPPFTEAVAMGAVLRLVAAPPTPDGPAASSRRPCLRASEGVSVTRFSNVTQGVGAAGRRPGSSGWVPPPWARVHALRLGLDVATVAAAASVVAFCGFAVQVAVRWLADRPDACMSRSPASVVMAVGSTPGGLVGPRLDGRAGDLAPNGGPPIHGRAGVLPPARAARASGGAVAGADRSLPETSREHARRLVPPRARALQGCVAIRRASARVVAASRPTRAASASCMTSAIRRSSACSTAHRGGAISASGASRSSRAR